MESLARSEFLPAPGNGGAPSGECAFREDPHPLRPRPRAASIVGGSRSHGARRARAPTERVRVRPTEAHLATVSRCRMRAEGDDAAEGATAAS